MNRMFLAGLCLLTAWGLSSCISSEMVYSRSHPPSAVKGGLIRYSMSESLHVNQKARELAYRKMHDYCASPYRVTNENYVYSSEDGTFLLKQSRFSQIFPGAFWYMDFECLDSDPH